MSGFFLIGFIPVFLNKFPRSKWMSYPL